MFSRIPSAVAVTLAVPWVYDTCMIRRLFTIASALSLLLCVALLADEVFQSSRKPPPPLPPPVVAITQNGGITTANYHISVSDVRVYHILGMRIRPPTAISVAAILPLSWLLIRLFLRLKSHPPEFACPKCGYDLRASKDRCPECGTPIPVKVETTA